MAVLSFVAGGYGLFAIVGICLSIVLLPALTQSMPAGRGGSAPIDMMELYSTLPGGIPFLIGQVTLGLIEACCLFAGGSGMLKTRPWARMFGLVYGGYIILKSVAVLVYSITVVNPATMEYMRRHGSASAGAMQNTGMTSVLSFFGAALWIALGVAFLVVMTRPQVVAAFSGQSDSGLDRGSRGPDDHDRPDEPNENIRLGRDDWNK